MTQTEDLINQIKTEEMDVEILWQKLKQQSYKAFKQYADTTKDSITFGDDYKCGYATFDHQTGNFIDCESANESIDTIYKQQMPKTIVKSINFSLRIPPRKLWTKYQNMRDELLPVCDLFLNQETVDMNYDTKSDYSQANYRLIPDTYAVRNIDAIYTAESVDDDVLKEVLSVVNDTESTTVMSLKQAQSLVTDWTVTFGNHKLILLCIPSGTDDPNGGMFPYLLANKLNYRYEHA
jgi:hypothetical protein